MPHTPRIDAGSMPHRINVMQNTVTYDAANQPQNNWTLLVSRWAKIESIAGGDYVQNQEIRNLSSHTITLRYLAGLNPRNQIQYQGRVFNVVAVVDQDERKFVMQAFVKEVV